MAKYSVRLEDTFTAAVTAGAIKVSAGTPRRLKIGYVEIGVSGADASNVYDIPLLRLSAAGAGTTTAVTPVALDPADTAALFTAHENYTVEPTAYTADSELLSFAFNQRATVQWTAKQGWEPMIAATASIGAGWRPATATALAGHILMHVEEQ